MIRETLAAKRLLVETVLLHLRAHRTVEDEDAFLEQ
jgi:hypothetical protein